MSFSKLQNIFQIHRLSFIWLLLYQLRPPYLLPRLLEMSFYLAFNLLRICCFFFLVGIVFLTTYQFKTIHRRFSLCILATSSHFCCSSSAHSLCLELTLNSFLVTYFHLTMELALPSIIVASAEIFSSPRLQTLWWWRESSSDVDTRTVLSVMVTINGLAGFGQHNSGVAILRN